MRALRWHGRGDVRLDEVEIAPPGPDDVVLDVLLCGVCGTDMEEFRHGPIVVPVQPHPLTGRTAPITLGHEVLGRVVARGSAVTALEIGARVVPDGLLSCGTCDSCRRGTPTLCENLASIGLHTDGGMAEQLVVPARMCLVVPDSVPDTLAVLIEPLAVAVRAVRRAQLTPGDRIGILGLGAIGQCVLQLVAEIDGETLVADRDDTRVELTLRAEPRSRKAGEGAHVNCVFDCAGTPASLAAAVDFAAPGGRVVLIGASDRAERFSPLAVTLKELTLVSSLSHDRETDTRTAIALLAGGTLRLDHVVTSIVPLADAAASIFANPVPAAGSVKTVIDPRPTV